MGLLCNTQLSVTETLADQMGRDLMKTIQFTLCTQQARSVQGPMFKSGTVGLQFPTTREAQIVVLCKEAYSERGISVRVCCSRINQRSEHPKKTINIAVYLMKQIAPECPGSSYKKIHAALRQNGTNGSSVTDSGLLRFGFGLKSFVPVFFTVRSTCRRPQIHYRQRGTEKEAQFMRIGKQNKG